MYTVILDWKGTLYDPNSKTLIRGAKSLLKFLREKNTYLVLIGKGSQNMYEEVERLSVRYFFEEIIFKEGIKTEKTFTPFIKKGRKNTFVIGDRIRSEIAIGKILNTTTIWLKSGKFKDELPTEGQEPTYTVSSLKEIKSILQEIIEPQHI